MNKERSVTVNLDFPLSLPDGKKTSVTIRRPTMGDIIDYPISGEYDVAGEMQLICALCGLNIEDGRMLDFIDYTKLQLQYARFRSASDTPAVQADGGGLVQSDAVESA